MNEAWAPLSDAVEYLDLKGVSPFGRWFDGLDARAAAKVGTAIARLRQGNLSSVKPVGEGVSDGGTKARQSRDIAEAKVRWADYKSRKRS